MSKAQVIFLKPANLAVVQLFGPYSETAQQAWTKIFAWLDHTKPEPKPDHGYGLSFGDPRKVANEKLRYIAGVVVPSNWVACDSNMVSSLRFDGGTFLRTRVIGPYTKIGLSISDLRDKWIPKNGLVLDQNQPVLTIYRSDTRLVAPEDCVADVCLPVFADRRSEPRNT